MHHPSRRAVLHGTAGLGALAALASFRRSPASAGEPDGSAAIADEGGDAATRPRDRDFVIGAGMTDAEADCWVATAEAAGRFFELPELHPMDRQEVASAIHVIQNKLLSRPTYRKYLELAKAGR